MIATAASLAALVAAGAFAATSPPTPDPDPSVPPGTPLTWVSYTYTMPAFTTDGRRLRGWKWRCVVPAHAPRRCTLIRARG